MIWVGQNKHGYSATEGFIALRKLLDDLGLVEFIDKVCHPDTNLSSY